MGPLCLGLNKREPVRCDEGELSPPDEFSQGHIDRSDACPIQLYQGSGTTGTVSGNKKGCLLGAVDQPVEC